MPAGSSIAIWSPGPLPLTPEEMDTNSVPVHMKHQGLSVGLNNLHGHINVRMASLGGKLSRQWRSGIAHCGHTMWHLCGGSFGVCSTTGHCCKALC